MNYHRSKIDSKLKKDERFSPENSRHPFESATPSSPLPPLVDEDKDRERERKKSGRAMDGWMGGGGGKRLKSSKDRAEGGRDKYGRRREEKHKQ